MKTQQRLCVACRQLKAQEDLLKLTVNHLTSQVVVNSNHAVFGRSAYICASVKCVDKALTNKRLKMALEGRRVKLHGKAYSIQWPLEVQLIKTLQRICAEKAKTCQNTLKEDSFNE